MKMDEKQKLKCSFCDKNKDEVKILVEGPNVYICGSCIDRCNEIVKNNDKSKNKENCLLKK